MGNGPQFWLFEGLEHARDNEIREHRNATGKKGSGRGQVEKTEDFLADPTENEIRF